MTAKRIDAHQHFWNRSKVAYPWLNPTDGPIYADFFPNDLAPQLKAAGIEQTIVVQAANSSDDTVAMLTQAEDYNWIGGVVGWVPLLDPAQTRRSLARYRQHPKFCGVRHPIYDQPVGTPVTQPEVIKSLRILAEYNFVFDVLPIYPYHLQYVPMLAKEIPDLRIVIDHLGKPPIVDQAMGAWAEQIAAVAQCPNVYAKISGLNTAAGPNWTSRDLKPYIDFAIDNFGAERVLWGSDWPICITQGDYTTVWRETNTALLDRSPLEVDAILGGTAARVYQV